MAGAGSQKCGASITTWRYKYLLNGKLEKLMAGSCPGFTIRQARDQHVTFEP
jgi:hypothetical protein